MCVDAGISCCTSQILVLLVWYVLVGASISIFFGEPEVNNIDKIAFLAKTHQKIVWFNVTVYEVLGVYIFNSTYLQTSNQHTFIA
jgi:hypothetical protein